MALVSGRREHGNTLVLEAILVAFLVIAAVTFAFLLQAPTRPSARSFASLAQTADDALENLAKLPPTDPADRSVLGEAITAAVGGNCTLAQTKLATLLPTDVRWQLLLDNGHGSRALCGAPPPDDRERASASRLLAPRWSPLVVLREIEPVAGNAAVGVLTLAVAAGEPVERAEGQITLTLNRSKELVLPAGRLLANKTFERTARADQGPDLASAAVYFLNETSEPRGSLRQCLVVNASAGCSATNLTFVLAVNESQGVAIPAGTELHARIPRHPAGFAQPETSTFGPGSDWDSFAVVPESDHWLVKARLSADLASAARTFRFNASLTATNNASLHVFDVRLSGGRGQCECVVEVRGMARANVSDNPAEGLYVGTARPMGSSAPALWTLTYANPSNISATLNEVRVRPSGLVASMQTVALGDGTTGGSLAWSVTGDAWVGSFSSGVTVPAGGVVDVVLRATAAGISAQAKPEEIALRFPENGYVSVTARLASSALYMADLPPDNGTSNGYPSSAGRHALHANVTGRSGTLQTQANVTVNASRGLSVYASELRDALRASSVAFTEREARLGETAAGIIDLRQLLFTLYNETDPLNGCAVQSTAAALPAEIVCSQTAVRRLEKDGFYVDASSLRINATVLTPVPLQAESVGAGGPAAVAWNPPDATLALQPDGRVAWNLTLPRSALLGVYGGVVQAAVKLVNASDAADNVTVTLLAADWLRVLAPGQQAAGTSVYNAVLLVWRDV